jgi:predicted HicB family RNase H-like nuclease
VTAARLAAVFGVRESAVAQRKWICSCHTARATWCHRGGVKQPEARDALTLRMPPRLHEQLRAAAVESGRSLNSEIVQRLTRTFEDPTLADQKGKR